MINKVSPFIHDGVKYFVDSYFIRTEYQQRGSQHNHVMLWLKSKDGQKPPSMWSDSDEDIMVTGQKIAQFAQSLIHGSTDCAKCSSHKEFDDTCEKCQVVRENVYKFQYHSHHQSCLKKKKFKKIACNEGHGRHDGNIDDFELTVPI